MLVHFRTCNLFTAQAEAYHCWSYQIVYLYERILKRKPPAKETDKETSRGNLSLENNIIQQTSKESFEDGTYASPYKSQ